MMRRNIYHLAVYSRRWRRRIAIRRRNSGLKNNSFFLSFVFNGIFFIFSSFYKLMSVSLYKANINHVLWKKIELVLYFLCQYCYILSFFNQFMVYSPLKEHSKFVRSTVHRARFNTFIMVASYTPSLVKFIRPSRNIFW